MSITWNTAAGNARLNACLTAAVLGQSVDGGAGNGQLVIGTSALSGSTGVLVTFTLSKPSFTIASKTATLLGVPLSATAANSGTAALAELRDSTGTTIGSGLTVGLSGSGADVIVSTTAITSGQTITCVAVSTIVTV